MPRTIAEIVRTWSRQYNPTATSSFDINTASQEEMDKALAAAGNDYPSKYERIVSQIDHLTTVLYDDYEITQYPPHQKYHYRLRDWLENVNDAEAQKTLFELAPRIFFIGRKEYLSLYHTAFNGPIARWLIDQTNINVSSDDAQSSLQSSLSSTWFCAITDSMKIASFYHINQLEGTDLRPDFRVLTQFAEATEVTDYMDEQTPKLERIVLLEDFVATGKQMREAVCFASTLQETSPIPVLLCPLVICRSGYKRAQSLVSKLSHLSFEPTLVLDDSVVLPQCESENEDEFLQRLRAVVKNTYTFVKGNSPSNLDGPFGFGAGDEKGGLMLVLCTNCPDNTLPLIHHQSNQWHPLFPRSSRV